MEARKILKIDCHTHIGCYRNIRWSNEYFPWGEVTPETLIGFLFTSGVNKAVVLPTCSWDIKNRMPTEHVFEACREFPNRFIPFCTVEVREEGFEEKLVEYEAMGCAGVGEHTSKIAIDHQLNLKLYGTCAKLELPILIHVATEPSNEYGVLDNVALDGLERVLKQYSNVNFIMHGPGWWRAMSAHIEDPAVAYPSHKIEDSGRTVYLLEEYENVHGDLSAYSGYNAFNRDMEFGKTCLQALDHKLLYGTDLEGFFKPEHSHTELLERAKLTQEAYENIYHRNLDRLLSM